MKMAPAVALAFVWCAAVVYACGRAWEATSRRDDSAAWVLPTGALLVRPCAGAEPGLDRALRSSRDPARSFPLGIRFAVASETDGAYPIALRVCDELCRQGLDVRVVVTGAVGPNRKADQIARVIDAETALPPVVIVADSDVDLFDFSLDGLVAPLARDRVAATWAPPVEVEPLTMGDRASAAVLDASLHSFSFLAALDPRGMVGKVFSVRTQALVAVGGMHGLKDVLGEDMELARRLRSAGLRTEVVLAKAVSIARGRSLSETVSRYARWIAVVRAQRPHLLASYPLFFSAAPLILSVLAIGAPKGALGAAAAVVAARSSAAWVARRASGRPSGMLSLWVDSILADLLLAVAFVRATTTHNVRWRGVTLRMSGRGKARSVREVP